MSINPKYVPILKWKQGEQGALKELCDDIKNDIIPLLQITPDFNEDKLLSTIKSWENRIFYFDVMPECYETDEEIYFRILKNLNPVFVIPVLTIDDNIEIIKEAADCSNNGFALRISTNDIESIENNLNLITQSFDESEIDLILDLKSINTDNIKEKFTLLKSILSDIENIESFRNIILSTSSFPETLTAISKYDSTSIDRLEWSFYLKCSDKFNSKYNINLIYSDYGIDTPKYVDFIPGMSPSFNIRYSCSNYFIVLKGDTVKKGGLDGENVSYLCEKLISLKDYKGEDFSSGDKFISLCANNQVEKFGNLSTWRKVGTNHHITLVIDQLSNLP